MTSTAKSLHRFLTSGAIAHIQDYTQSYKVYAYIFSGAVGHTIEIYSSLQHPLRLVLRPVRLLVGAAAQGLKASALAQLLPVRDSCSSLQSACCIVAVYSSSSPCGHWDPHHKSKISLTIITASLCAIVSS